MYISYYNWPFLWWSVDAFASICVFLVTLRANLRLRHIPLAPSGVATQMATKRYLRGGGVKFSRTLRHSMKASKINQLGFKPSTTHTYLCKLISKNFFQKFIFFSILVWQPWKCCSLWQCFSWLVLQHNSSEIPSIYLEVIDAPTGPHHLVPPPPHSRVAALLLPQEETEGKIQK